MGAYELPASFFLTDEEFKFLLDYRVHLWDLLHCAMASGEQVLKRLAYSIACCLASILQEQLSTFLGDPSNVGACRCRHGDRKFYGTVRTRHSAVCSGDCQNLWDTGNVTAGMLKELVKVSISSNTASSVLDYGHYKAGIFLKNTL